MLLPALSKASPTYYTMPRVIPTSLWRAAACFVQLIGLDTVNPGAELAGREEEEDGLPSASRFRLFLEASVSFFSSSPSSHTDTGLGIATEIAGAALRKSHSDSPSVSAPAFSSSLAFFAGDEPGAAIDMTSRLPSSSATVRFFTCGKRLFMGRDAQEALRQTIVSAKVAL